MKVTFNISIGQLDVVKNNQYRLVIERPTIGSVSMVLLLLGFLALWYFFVYRSDMESIMKLLFYLAPLVGLAKPLFIYCSAILFGEKYVFHKRQKYVTKNNQPWFKFSELREVLIEKEYDEDDSDYHYELKLVSIGGHHYPLDESHDEDEIRFIAEEIASALEFDITVKEL